MNDHPCRECESKAADRAIICPALGVIDANRSKRIKRHTADDAFEMLYGLRQGRHNTRDSIKVKRTGLDTERYHTYLVLKGGLSILTLRKPKRGPAESVGLPSDTSAEGARGEALKGVKEALLLPSTAQQNGLAPELQALELAVPDTSMTLNA